MLELASDESLFKDVRISPLLHFGYIGTPHSVCPTNQETVSTYWELLQWSGRYAPQANPDIC